MPTEASAPRFRSLRDREMVTILFEGERLRVPADISVAAALLLHGKPSGRLSAQSASQRGAYCLIGHCFECSMTIDGVPYRQACLTPVSEGLVVERQVA